MAFNGSGTFLRVRNWVQDAAANIRIRADRHDSEDDNFAQGLSQCITKDGQTTITANLPMANYRHTNVGEANAINQYARYDQLQLGKAVWAAAGGTADAITASYSPNTIDPVDGQLYYVRASAANATTTPTFSPDGTTAQVITKYGAAPLAAGDISGAGHELILRYRLSDTKYELLNPNGVPTLSGNNTFAGDNTFTGDVRFPNDGTLTIASGAITVTGVYHTIDTEASAATDDLETINGGVSGQILILRTTDSARHVVLKSTGNIDLVADVTLISIDSPIELIYDGATSKWLQRSATAGQGAKADTALQALPVGSIINTVKVDYTANADLTVAIPLDNTIPQNTEGTQIISTTYTMKNSANKIRVRFLGHAASPAYSIAALFTNTNANAVATGIATAQNNTYYLPLAIPDVEITPAAASIDLKVRVGANTGTMRMNGGISAGLFGGTMLSTLIIEEIVV